VLARVKIWISGADAGRAASGPDVMAPFSAQIEYQPAFCRPEGRAFGYHNRHLASGRDGDLFFTHYCSEEVEFEAYSLTINLYLIFRIVLLWLSSSKNFKFT
jgi:hypothetical protein